MLHNYFFIVLMLLPTLLHGAGVYVALLLDNNNPYKFKILISDYHGLHKMNPSLKPIEVEQISLFDDLLEELKKVAGPLSIELLFEGSQYKIDFVKKNGLNPKDLHLYNHIINVFSSEKALPISLKPCDTRNKIDSFGTACIHEFLLSNGAKIYHDKDTPLRELSVYNLADDRLLIWRSSHYQAFISNPESFVTEEEASITLSDYLNRLHDLHDYVTKVTQQLPADYRLLAEKFYNAEKNALQLIRSFPAPPSTSLLRYIVLIATQSQNDREAWKNIQQLFTPGYIASNIGMLLALIESQKSSDTTILLAGGDHILDILPILLKDHTLINEYDTVTCHITTQGQHYRAFRRGPLEDLVKTLALRIGILRLTAATDKETVNRLLHFAALLGYPEFVTTLLIRHGTSINDRNERGETPLHEAALRNYLTVVQTLINNSDIDINARIPPQSSVFPNATPLQIAAAEGRHEIVRELIRYGASFDPNSFEHLACISAFVHNRLLMAVLFNNAQAQDRLRHASREHVSEALLYAAAQRNAAIVTLLLQREPDTAEAIAHISTFIINRNRLSDAERSNYNNILEVLVSNQENRTRETSALPLNQTATAIPMPALMRPLVSTSLIQKSATF
jgi:hypothetical protein